LPSEENSSHKYTTIRIPKELLDEVDQIIRLRKRGYRNKSEFIIEALRKRVDELTLIPTSNLPVLEHFNIDEQGVRILDRTLSSKTSQGRIIDVYFKPGNVWCDYCQSNNCRHAEFALSLPAVQDILSKKGWNIKT
jgi:Arc/MetJ-type ribon-helix-helix transcriptional regulator